MGFGVGGFSDRPPPSDKKGFGKRWIKRLFRKGGETEDQATSIIMLDDVKEPFGFDEHQCRIDDDWRNWFTCPVKCGFGNECPICDTNFHRAHFVGALTCIDRRTFEHNGEQRGDEKMLCVMREQDSVKRETEFKMVQRAHKLRSWQYTEWLICRPGTGSQSSTIGDIWNFVRVWTREELEQEFAAQLEQDPDFLEPFDYKEILAPKPLDELRAVARKLSGRPKNKGGAKGGAPVGPKAGGARPAPAQQRPMQSRVAAMAESGQGGDDAPPPKPRKQAIQTAAAPADPAEPGDADEHELPF